MLLVLSFQVHIDGHSDRMLPLAIDKFPFFRYPANKNEISAMMQRNDVFISVSIGIPL